MDHAMSLLLRDDGGAEPESHSLGLGWLLAIALGGGVLLFMTIGLLLVWWLRKKRGPGPRTVYGYPSTADRSLARPSTSRLTKRRLLASESSSRLSSRFSSRFSFSAPPVSAALPTYRSVSFYERNNPPGDNPPRGRKRSRSWVDEDNLHGPKMGDARNHQRKSVMGGWFGKDSWFGLSPTLPNLGSVEKGEGGGQKTELPDLENQRSHELSSSRTVPGLSSRSATSYEELTRSAAIEGKIHAPKPVHFRNSVTDSNLKVILQSTDLRLHDKKGQPPVKTPKSSPTKATPTKLTSRKTPRSHRTVSSHGSGRTGGISSSPSKRAGLHITTSKMGSRQASVNSISSAANSLIAAATQELALPGGASSPSKAKQVQWENQQQMTPTNSLYRGSQRQSPQRLSPQKQSPQRQSPRQKSPQKQSPNRQMPPMLPAPVQYYPIRYPEGMRFPQLQQQPIPILPPQIPMKSPGRRMSHESDKSSSLSTLYSTNEPEEKKPEPTTNRDDPFVDKRHPRRRLSWQARRPTNFESLRRAKTLTSASLTRYVVDDTAFPPPLRPASSVATAAAYDKSIEPSTAPNGLVQVQPAKTAEDTATHRLTTSTLPEARSEASFVSMSVASDTTEMPGNTTPKAQWHDSLPESPATPASKGVDLSSSPYTEQELMEMVTSALGIGRVLPIPPTSVIGPDGDVITALSPRPKADTGRGRCRISASSSVYSTDAAGNLGILGLESPSGQSSVGSILEVPPLSSTILELRRMNSVVSSAASSASSPLPDGDSPTLPDPRGRLAVRRSQLKGLTTAGTISSRHYLNMGKSSPLNGRKISITARQRRSEGGRRLRSSTLSSPDFQGYGKENQGQGLRLPRNTDGSSPSGLRDGSRGVNLNREAVKETTKEIVPLGAVKHRSDPVIVVNAEQKGDERPESVQGLGLYDKDGFLLCESDEDTVTNNLRI